MNDMRSAYSAHRAKIVPDVFPVYRETAFDVVITAGEAVYGGSIIEVQLPNSFTNDKVSPSKVKSWQTADPAGPHFICVTAGRLPPGDLRVDIRPREYVGGYHAPTRHGRCLVIELLRGTVEPGEEITVSYRSTTSPWLANQRPGESDHEGPVLVMIDGVKIEPAPA